MQVEVTVEIPQGERNKYEMDHDTGRIHLDRLLFTATRYPAEYGFLDHTLGRDGDPLDALVLTEAPTFPGCIIAARPVGMFVMDDEYGSDNKVLTVPAADPRYEQVRDVDDLPEYTRAEIAHFFEVYKQLEPGRQVTGTRWATRADALAEIADATRRYGGADHRSGAAASPESGAEGDEVVPNPQFDRAGPRPVAAPAAHVVLGYRDGPLGQAVLGVGADLAARLGAALHVVHVVDLSDYPIDPDSPDWERQAQQTLAHEQRDVEDALARRQHTSWTYHAAHGDPVALLRQVADTHDALMFIVGSRGEGAASIASRLIGVPSVSHGLIARSHRPVLVVPPRAARSETRRTDAS